MRKVATITAVKLIRIASLSLVTGFSLGLPAGVNSTAQAAATARYVGKDGIEVDAFDERLMFRVEDVGSVFLESMRFHECAANTYTVRLDEWLTSTPLAACIEKLFPDLAPPDPNVLNGKIELRMMTYKRDEVSYFAGFKTAALPPGVRIDVEAGPYLTKFGPIADRQGDWQPVALGYERLKDSKTSALFRLPASARNGRVSRPLVVRCYLAGGNVCAVHLRSSDRKCSLTFSWADSNNKPVTEIEQLRCQRPTGSNMTRPREPSPTRSLPIGRQAISNK